MGKCKACGKSGLFLKLENGLCESCLKKQNYLLNKTETYSQFIKSNKDKLNYFEKVLIDNRYIAMKKDTPIDKKIQALKENLKLYPELNKLCKENGKNGEKYYNSMFVNLKYNISYEKQDLELLTELQNNNDKLNQEEN